MPTPPLAVSTAQAAGALGVAAIAALAYAARTHRVADRRLAIPPRRQAAFYAGLVLAAASVLGLDHLSHIAMVWRETQHFLLGELATLLVVIGLAEALAGGRPAPPARRTPQWLTLLAHPIPAFALWLADLYVWHLPSLYQSAVEHPGIQAAQQVCLLASGINMWLCVLGAVATPAWFGDVSRLCYVVATRIGAAVLANIFLWSGAVSYPYFVSLDTARHLSPVVDENLAGAVMLGGGSVLCVCLFAWLYTRARTTQPTTAAAHSTGRPADVPWMGSPDAPPGASVRLGTPGEPAVSRRRPPAGW